MSNTDLELKSLWQSGPTVDIHTLLRHVARERRRMQAVLWVEIAACIASVGMFVYYDAAGVFGEQRWLAWGVIAVSMVVQIWMWRWRRGLWNATTRSPRELLTLQLSRARVGLRIGRYYAYGTPICTLLAFAGARFIAPNAPALSLSVSARLAVLAGLASVMIGLTVWGFRMIRRYRDQIAHINTQLKEFEHEDQRAK
ncbi:MAG: hypothetical protein AAF610_12600 [Pseudomonadota bacterium]